MGAVTNPMAAKDPHYAPKAKSVIYLFMAGGPSQFELFQPKPKLQELSGQVIPNSFMEGKRFAFMESFQDAPAEAARDAPKVPTIRAVGSLGFRVPAAHRASGRRSRFRPIGVD